MPDISSFYGWGEYLGVSLPATIMCCAEWWAVEILVGIAGTMGVPQQASQTMVASINYLLIMAPMGVQEASTGLIGNCIGADNVQLAKRFFSLIGKINTIMVAILSLTTVVARK